MITYALYMPKTVISVRKRDSEPEYGATLPLGCSLEQPPKWNTLHKVLTKAARNKSMDTRLRVLATIYRHGYVLRPAIVFWTRLSPPRTVHEEDEIIPNYLHLRDDGEPSQWYIYEDDVHVQTLCLPLDMVNDLLDIIRQSEIHAKGWLLPKLNGMAYGMSMTLPTFAPWHEQKLPNYGRCRESLEAWYKEEGHDLSELAVILTHVPAVEPIDTHPLPVQCAFCLGCIQPEDRVALQLEGQTTWRQCQCCKDCLLAYRDSRWSMLLEQLSGTDCLGQLKGFQKREVYRSLPFGLSTDDMVLGQVDTYCKIHRVKLEDGTEISPSFNPTMTEEVRAVFHKEMCGLDITDVTEDEIRAICSRYKMIQAFE